MRAQAGAATGKHGVTQPPGVAMRQYGTVRPLGGPDGGYAVFERIDYAEAVRHAPSAAAAMKRSFADVATMGGGAPARGR